MPQTQSKTPVFPALWVCVCAFCNVAGWIFSAVHQLNLPGYAIAVFGALVACWLGRNSLPGKREWLAGLRFPRRRFHRFFPLAFLALAFLAILGGVIHAPNNYDALAYRTPRVLHWLAEGQWYWIHTDFGRLNNRGCGIEWVTAPLVLFTYSDRGIFLINAISFLLLPGRVFSLLTRLGVGRRMAWCWTWLAPSGYCYLIQAGSIGNDLFGAVQAMIAIEFALRARQSGRPGELCISMLAAALMTAGKAFNLLLLLPWAIAAFPSLRLLRLRPALFALTAAAGVLSSMVPSAVLNQHYCGDWKGLAAEPGQILGGSPAVRLPGNVALTLLHNLTPPIFPFAGVWNRLMERTIPPGVAAALQKNFEPAGAKMHADEMQMEEQAGLGFGLVLLLAVTLIYRLCHRNHQSSGTLFSKLFKIETLVVGGMWVAVFAYMIQMGLSCPQRYLAPLYVILIVPVLAGTGSINLLPRKTWWRRLGVFVFLLAGVLVVVSPARPLWPAVTILKALGAEQAHNPLVRRAWTVYSVYGARADGFAPARAALPPGANPLGFIAFDDPETSLWRPFFSRRILHVKRADTPEQLKAKGLTYVLVSSRALDIQYRISLDDWLRQYNADLVQRLSLELRASVGPSDWYLVKLR